MMTKEALFDLIDSNDGEIRFEDEYSLTDWSGARFCTYSPDQNFGEGEICGFEKALAFYNKHNGGNTQWVKVAEQVEHAAVVEEQDSKHLKLLRA